MVAQECTNLDWRQKILPPPIDAAYLEVDHAPTSAGRVKAYREIAVSESGYRKYV